MYFVYILNSKNSQKYYVGQTGNLEKRIKEHNDGKVSFTKRFMPWELKLQIIKQTRTEALILERKLKNLNQEDLIAFIRKYSV